jgi:peptidyl-prolyl cis-trans isomerase B (cyclophilin B)
MSRLNAQTSIMAAAPKCLLTLLIPFLALSISCRNRALRDDVVRNQLFAEMLKMETRGWLESEKFFSETLRSNPYPDMRQWCILAIGRMAPRQALHLLYPSLRTDDAALRATIAFAIGEIESRARAENRPDASDSSVVAVLRRLLDDPALPVQRRAVEALGNIGSPAEAAEIALHLEHCPGIQPEERAFIESSLVALAKILKGNSEQFFDLTRHSRFADHASIAWTQSREALEVSGTEREPIPDRTNIPEEILPSRFWSDAFYAALAVSRKNSTIAAVETNRGTLEIELFREDAPVTVATFVLLAKSGTYDNMELYQAPQKHRVEATISRTRQGFAHNIYSEVNLRPFERGRVGMALANRLADPGRFFISLAPLPYLNGIATCFGQIVSGMQVAETITAGDRIKHISIRETISFLDYRRY